MSTCMVEGQRLELLPEKAAYLPEHRTLLIADAHIGKAVSFRALGVPVPERTTDATLASLSALVSAHAARRIVFLGDLLHSARAHADTTMAAVGEWRERHPDLELTLVRGNHDDRAGDPPRHLGIDAVDEPLAFESLRLCHHPRACADGYVLGGHLHPCITIGGRPFDRLRLPCFWFGARVGVLPAFGAFTGMHPIRPRPDDRVYVVADSAVSEVRRA